jgi:hypothetical protein
MLSIQAMLQELAWAKFNWPNRIKAFQVLSWLFWLMASPSNFLYQMSALRISKKKISLGYTASTSLQLASTLAVLSCGQEYLALSLASDSTLAYKTHPNASKCRFNSLKPVKPSSGNLRAGPIGIQFLK